MTVINIVYVATKAEGYIMHKGACTVIWSRRPLVGCDLYAYTDPISYYGAQRGIDVLLHAEPIVVLPFSYQDEVLDHFDLVFTPYEALLERGGKFRRYLLPHYDLPMEAGYTKPIELFDSRPLLDRKDAICMIIGNKSSAVPGELYSKRAEVAYWFDKYSDTPFDVYGKPPFDLPNYRGALTPYSQKFDTLRQYRFSLAFENIYHPVWSRGFFTDRMIDCLMCGTIPIYLGCYNVEDFVPAGCFIDYRQFKDNAELDSYLQDISQAEYIEFSENISEWVNAGNLERWSFYRLYDKLLQVLEPETSGGELVNEPWQPSAALDHAKRDWQALDSKPLWKWADLGMVMPSESLLRGEFTQKESIVGSQARLNAIRVYPDSLGLDVLGYDDVQITSNGEEQVIAKLLKPDDVIFDVGANQGQWGKLALSHVSPLELYAFEPVPETFGRLQTNLRPSGASLHNFALSDQQGERTFYYYDKTSEIAELSTFYRRHPTTEQELDMRPAPIQVITETLDGFCAEHSVQQIDFLKIAVEGAELDVLQGAFGLLQAQRIRLIQFETGDTFFEAGISLQKVLALLSAHGYAVFRVLPQGLAHIAEWRPALENGRFANYLAASKEAADGHAVMQLSEETPPPLPKKEPVATVPSPDKLVGIIFSKDRAMQLEATLRSFALHCTDPSVADLKVLYAASSPLHAQQYLELESEYAHVDFVREKSFKEDLLALLQPARWVLFLCDDDFFVRDFDLTTALQSLERAPHALGFSLRLGKNTAYEYMSDQMQTLPNFEHFGDDILSYPWTEAELDFGYPLELGSSVYRVYDLFLLLKIINFQHPNTLEALLDANKNYFRLDAICCSAIHTRLLSPIRLM